MHEIRMVEGFPERELAAIAALAGRLGAFNEAHFRRQLERRHQILSCLALRGDELVGYKIGYEERPAYFESWVGGVSPDSRRSGIAADLMAHQHRWCAEHGFKLVTTITEGSNHAMLILNLRSGFDVVGTFLDRRKVLKVMLQKHLESQHAS